jgi:hypothetical protein
MTFVKPPIDLNRREGRAVNGDGDIALNVIDLRKKYIP